MSHSKDRKEKQPENTEAPVEEAGGEIREEAGETVSEIDTMKKDIEALKVENSELKDQFLRKSADFENYRKRMAKEKQDTVKYGNQELLKDLVEVVDNFERAIKSAGSSQDFEAFKDGISMTEQHFAQLLSSRWGLKKIDEGEVEFNPELHEALYQEPREGLEMTTVLEILQTGYILHDRVIRPAKVKVGVPPNGN